MHCTMLLEVQVTCVLNICSNCPNQTRFALNHQVPKSSKTLIQTLAWIQVKVYKKAQNNPRFGSRFNSLFSTKSQKLTFLHFSYHVMLPKLLWVQEKLNISKNKQIFLPVKLFCSFSKPSLFYWLHDCIRRKTFIETVIFRDSSRSTHPEMFHMKSIQKENIKFTRKHM